MPASAFQGIEPVRHFKLDGRVSVKTESQRFSGGLSWQRSSGDEQLLLTSPLGQGAAEISRKDGALVLIGADGAVITAANDELLLEKVLGLKLPLEGLVYWLSGLPRPGVTFLAEQDQDGRMAALEQDGWRIEYDRFRALDGRMLPGRLFAQRGDDLEFRLVVDHWERQ